MSDDPNASGAPMSSSGDMVPMVGPDGWRGTVPADKVDEALKGGYRVETRGEYKARENQALYGDSSIRAGLEGAARGATFGLSDVYLGQDPGVAERRALNPVAATIGELGGGVAGLGLTGVGGLAERAGSALIGGGEGILARAGAAAVRGGLEGAALGTGSGISDVALAKDPMTAEAIAGTLGHHMLVGAGTGAALGGGLSLAGSAARAGLDAAVGTAGKFVRKAADKLKGELADNLPPAIPGDPVELSAPALTAARDAEVAAGKADRLAQGQSIAGDLRQFFRDSREDLFKFRQELPNKGLVGDAIAATKPLKRILTDMRGLAEDPVSALKPVRALDQSIEEMQRFVPADALAPMRERLADLESRIVKVRDAGSSERLQAIEANLKAIEKGPAPTPTLDKMSQAAGTALGGGIGRLSGIPFGGYIGTMLGKELGGDVMKPLLRRVLGTYADSAGGIEAGISDLLSKVKPPESALSALDDLATAGAVKGSLAGSGGKRGDSLDAATTALAQAAADPAATQANIQQQLGGLAAVAPQLAQAVGQQMQLKLQFLGEKAPKRITMGISGQVVPPSDSEKQTFARYVAAASDPLRMVKELRAGTLMPETVETAKALFPTIYQKTVSALGELVSDPKTAAAIPYATRLQLGMLMGPTTDATTDPGFVQQMQSTFQRPPLKVPQNPPKTSKIEPPTATQRLTME